jgi:hypothetical protein
MLNRQRLARLDVPDDLVPISAASSVRLMRKTMDSTMTTSPYGIQQVARGDVATR